MAVDVYEVAQLLIGQITPVGECHTDEKRLENLKKMTALADALLQDIHDLRSLSGSHEASVQAAVRHANKFLLYVRSEYT
mgnify:CR=1 FL=1